MDDADRTELSAAADAETEEHARRTTGVAHHLFPEIGSHEGAVGRPPDQPAPADREDQQPGTAAERSDGERLG